LEILNQPHGSQLGDKLNELLEQNEKNKFETFFIVVAYVKRTGVAHLKKSLEKFRVTGGKVKAVVGIDQRNTSVQGLQLLQSLCDDIWVYHNECLGNTFHPKIYAFEKAGDKATVFVGSSNLTEGGLYANYEINSSSEYDLKDPEQAKAYSDFRRMFDDYSKPSNLSKQLTPELIETLNNSGYLSDERKIQKLLKARSAVSHRQNPVFGTERVQVPYVSKIPESPEAEEVVVEIETEAEKPPEQVADHQILVRYIPRAGGRVSQVHFTRRIIEKFFHLPLVGGGQATLRLRQVQPNEEPEEIEERTLVYSEINANPKIELRGAKALVYRYPTSGKVPIVILEEVSPDFYDYMILLPNDDGYDELSKKLDSQPQEGRALRFWITDLVSLLKVWKGYPLR
jgi:HKD family nuclease